MLGGAAPPRVWGESGATWKFKASGTCLTCCLGGWTRNRRLEMNLLQLQPKEPKHSVDLDAWRLLFWLRLQADCCQRLEVGRMFRILVVDDDPAAAHLLLELTKNLQLPHELYFAKDGVEALDFVHCRGAYVDAPRPNLILLDMNMPRLGGLETLSTIKNDPELCVIPVIMLSSSSSPQDVRKCYQAHANCYVLKPTDLDRSVKLVQVVEAFWMDFALLPSCDERTLEHLGSTDPTGKPPPPKLHARGVSSGQTIATESEEATSRAMRITDSPAKGAPMPSRHRGCEEHNRLLDEFGEVVQELLRLHEQQFLAVVEGDIDCYRFDLLIHMANEKKQLAKYAYLRHVESHGCSNTNALNQA